MRHVRSHGVSVVPEVLGVEDDHEILAWIPGDEGAPDLGDDERIFEIGAVVRQVRDALSTFRPPEPATWRLRPPGPTFVHGDIAPWNVVVRDGQITGLLDWDQAGPGRWLEDLAYAAWVWAPLESPDNIPSHWIVRESSVEAQARRLRVLLDGFGLAAADRAEMLGEISYVMALSVGRVAVGAMSGDAGMHNIWWDGQRIGVFGSSMTWITQQWGAFQRALLP